MRDHKDIQAAFANSHTADDAIDWRELYRMKAVEDYEAKRAATERIKQKYAALRADKEASQVRIVAQLPSTSRKARSITTTSGTPPTIGKSTQGQRMMSNARKKAHVITRAAHAPRSGELIKPQPLHKRAGSTVVLAESNSRVQTGKPVVNTPTSNLSFDFVRKRDNPSSQHGPTSPASPSIPSSLQGKRPAA